MSPTGSCTHVHALDLLELEVGAISVMDRGYVDFARLHALHLAGAFFVTRAKTNMAFHRVYSAATDRATGIICDQSIALDGFYTRQDYPAHLRRVCFKDLESGKTVVFLTNPMTLPAATICARYKSRWQVELFFKWIKQHLRIKRFFGTSGNVVKAQIWIAVSVYVLVAIVKKKLQIDASLYTLRPILSVTLFEKMPLRQAFPATQYTSPEGAPCNQLNLFAINRTVVKRRLNVSTGKRSIGALLASLAKGVPDLPLVTDNSDEACVISLHRDAGGHWLTCPPSSL